jgi:serine/threonine protein kinase
MGEMFGPYDLQRLLGRGGMGEVFEAYDSVQDRQVAVKRLMPHLADDTEFQRRFRRESRLAARLRNAHIIPIHSYGEINDQLFIDMRLVDGCDLERLLAGEGPMSPERAVKVTEQVASALDSAHADGLIHRDIKPSNILVDTDEFVYLADFGITRALGGDSQSLTSSHAVVGSLDYMAPEQFDGQIGPGVDIYSLGCVLFQCLTGTKPFPVEGLPALMRAHMNQEPPLPSERHRAATTRLDSVVQKALAKDTRDRFGSAGELAAAARAALSEQRYVATVAGSTERPGTGTAPTPVASPAGDGGERLPGADRPAVHEIRQSSSPSRGIVWRESPSQTSDRVAVPAGGVAPSGYGRPSEAPPDPPLPPTRPAPSIPPQRPGSDHSSPRNGFDEDGGRDSASAPPTLVGGGPDAAEPPHEPEPRSERRRRLPWLVAAAVAVVLAVVATTLTIGLGGPSQADSGASPAGPSPAAPPSMQSMPGMPGMSGTAGMPGTAGAPNVSTPSGPVEAPPAVQQFLPHIPAGIMCEQMMPMAGGVTHMHCSSGPYTIMYEVFSDGVSANSGLAAQAQSVGAAPGNCATPGTTAIDRFHGTNEQVSVGHMLCYDGPEGTAYAYVLDNFPGVMTTVVLPGPSTGRTQLAEAFEKDSFGPREPAGSGPSAKGVCTPGECGG